MRLLMLLLGIWLLPLAWAATGVPRGVTAEEMALFNDALKNTAQEPEYWAYTETTLVTDSKGRKRQDAVVRFDPSKPYAEQFTPLSIEGKPPTEKQLKEYRERGEKRGKKVAESAAAVTDPTAKAKRPLVNVGGRKLPLDIEHPQVAAETADEVVFSVPLLAEASEVEVPMDKIQVLARVSKGKRQFEQVTFRILESFRLKLVAKVKAGEVRLDFAVVDPKFGPVITSMAGDYSLSFLFVPFTGTFANTRTDWQRVKPYNERLQVKLGPLQFLD